MNVLDQICDRKKEHIRVKQQEMPLPVLKEKLKETETTRGFKSRILSLMQAGSVPLIAEIKKASPSGGVIRPDFDPPAIARDYEGAGVACLSVLTDVPFFQGDDSYIASVKAACALPVLRKDFMLDPYQIYESRALGADCVLLIMAALETGLAAELHDLARELSMDVLVEVHNAAEFEKALTFSPGMVGVNNRDLKSLKVDLSVSESLASLYPEGTLAVSESGVATAADIARLRQAGYGAFLVGESLMRRGDIGKGGAQLLFPLA